MTAHNSRTHETSPPALRPQGADLLPNGGVRHRLWAPHATAVEAVVFDESGKEIRRSVPLEKEAKGFFSVVDSQGAAGQRYKYRLDGTLLPDPFSRWQPDDVSDPSMVIDPHAYRWQCSDWERLPLSASVLYELHVGTFTSAGTFRGAIDRLDALVDLGVTTIEVMPIAAFPGKRNWGYDGVMLFAPDSSYGNPDDLRALVDAAHLRGLNVILDVVYNHFGPDGNYLASYSPYYFNPEVKTPWGDAIRFSGENAGHVRALFLANIRYWLQEFRFDGFRLDATHEIVDNSTPHILTEIARTAHQAGGVVLAEDDRNLASLAHPAATNGNELDGLWADDFHHTVRVALTGEREGYFGNFEGTPEELVETLRNGWFYRGQTAPLTKSARGTPPGELRLEQFVHCIANHDQTGNQAFGERINHLVSPEAYRAASALLCLTPGTPLLFMGQEWAASSPFLYFTDHHDELGKKVTEGRRREFQAFIEKIHKAGKTGTIPDPQEEVTFLESKLQWDEIALPAHAQVLHLYQELLRLRLATPAIRKRTRDNVQVRLSENGIAAITYQDTAHSGLLVLVDLKGGHRWDRSREPFSALPPGWTWRPFLSTNEIRFGGKGSSALASESAAFAFDLPEVLLLQPVRQP